MFCNFPLLALLTGAAHGVSFAQIGVHPSVVIFVHQRPNVSDMCASGATAATWHVCPPQCPDFSDTCASEQAHGSDMNECVLRTFRLGSFCCGIPQDSLAHVETIRAEVQPYLQHVVHQMVTTPRMDMLCLCGVGSYNEDIAGCAIPIEELPVFADAPETSIRSFYVSSWGWQDRKGRSSILSTSYPQLCSFKHSVFELDVFPPQLSIQTFTVFSHTSLILGNLQLVVREDCCAPLRAKQKYLRAALGMLSKAGEDMPAPVIYVLCGDTGLTCAEAFETLDGWESGGDPNEDKWTVHGSKAALPGDTILVKGIAAEVAPIRLGTSFLDEQDEASTEWKFLSQQNHDAVGIEITLWALRTEEEEREKRRVPLCPAAPRSKARAKAKATVTAMTENPYLQEPEDPADEKSEELSGAKVRLLPRVLPVVPCARKRPSCSPSVNPRVVLRKRHDQAFESDNHVHAELAQITKPSSPDGVPQPVGPSTCMDSEVMKFFLGLNDELKRSSLASQYHWCLNRPDEEKQKLARALNEMDALQNILFKKQRSISAADVWSHGMNETAEGEAFVPVSKPFVFTQLRAVIEKREEYLSLMALPMNYTMNGEHRLKFERWCKSEFEDSPLQQLLIKRDLEHESNTTVRQRRRNRWHLELQRRLGGKHFWEVVSFTGQFEVDLLQAVALSAKDDSLCRSAEANAKLKAEAKKWKDRLHWGYYLCKERSNGRHHQTKWQKALLREWDSGALQDAHNDAIQACGHGRLWFRDGSYKDIGGDFRERASDKVLRNLTGEILDDLRESKEENGVSSTFWCQAGDNLLPA